MIPSDLVDLSRLQFAVTAMYHFIFVPLTLGLSFMLVAMEVTYVLTGKEIYKDMTRFWGKLFGINFALGVATGITMEFQFGTNWAYYSHYVGDIFGAPLAIEGLMAFFLESTFIGLFFFGWDRLSKGKHLAATILMAVGSNLSALWILVANAWMMNPVGAEFNFQTMRMEMVDFWAVLTNEWAQAKFVHTVAGLDPAGPANPLAKTVEIQAGAWFANFASVPVLWLVPALGVIGALGGAVMVRANKPGFAFVLSAASLLGIILTPLLAMFPFVMPSSTMPNAGLTLWDCTSSQLTLEIMLFVTLIFLPLVLLYTGWAYKVMSGKLNSEYIEKNSHSLY